MKIRPAGIEIDRLLRRFLPRTLFGRSLLIVLVPLILVEAVALDIFYGSHLSELSRRLADAVAGEIVFVNHAIERSPGDEKAILADASNRFGFVILRTPGVHISHVDRLAAIGPADNDLAAALGDTFGRHVAVIAKTGGEMITVQLERPTEELTFLVPRKRLYVGALYIFVVWSIGTTVLVAVIAGLFLRTQVRAIRRLAIAAEQFGMGRDPGPIRPEGAQEVRRAATAFNRMRDRIGRFVESRTAMLAGVSHDLRTPLTRMRLALAMLPQPTAGLGMDAEPSPELAEVESDIAEMEALIGAYLSFARGEGTEAAQPVDLALLLEDIAHAARRTGARVLTDAPPSLFVTLRPEAMRRAIGNVVENARRFGARIVLAGEPEGERAVRITVDDDGPGIPKERRDAVFRPFESSRAGGTGLGLAIARDIVGAHGGDIYLADSPLGGLRVVITLPT
jgi:two-component system, OmpR family, osmolarity sensor histidine kinase EnvZ